jgi:hypothetical protein
MRRGVGSACTLKRAWKWKEAPFPGLLGLGGEGAESVARRFGRQSEELGGAGREALRDLGR